MPDSHTQLGRNIALLIDADNASHNDLESVLTILGDLGTVSSVQAREFADGILRLQVTVSQPLTAADFASWSGSRALQARLTASRLRPRPSDGFAGWSLVWAIRAFVSRATGFNGAIAAAPAIISAGVSDQPCSVLVPLR